MITPNTKVIISEIIISRLLNEELLYNFFRLNVIFCDREDTGWLKVVSLGDYKLIVEEQNSQIPEPIYL